MEGTTDLMLLWIILSIFGVIALDCTIMVILDNRFGCQIRGADREKNGKPSHPR